MLKIFTNILIIISVSVLCTSCGNKDLRGYAFGHINKTYAKKLKNCERYKAPVYVHAPLIIPVSKWRSEIVGVKNNRCILREYEADGFSFYYRLFKEYALPYEFTKDLSILLQDAFKDPEFQEQEALKWSKSFCTMYKIYCYDDVKDYQIRFYDVMSQIEDYMSSEIMDPKNEKIILEIYKKQGQEELECNAIAKKLERRIMQNPNLEQMNRKQKEQIICEGYTDNKQRSTKGYCMYHSKYGKWFYTKETDCAKCSLDFNKNGIIKKYFQEKDINRILRDKNIR